MEREEWEVNFVCVMLILYAHDLCPLCVESCPIVSIMLVLIVYF